MAKPKQKLLETMTREELIEKCKNQRESIKQLIEINKFMLDKMEFVERFENTPNGSHKIQVCINETLSLFNDIERLKQENARLENEIKTLKGE